MHIGFDVGGTNARGILLDPDGHRIVARAHRPSPGPPDLLVSRLAEMTAELLERAPAPEQVTVGLGIAGLAHRSGVVRYSPNLPELVEAPIGPDLAVRTGRHTVVTNDATAAALAEARAGAGRGASDVLVLTLGTGIGAGFVADGRLIQGANGFAGEVGHMFVNFDGPTHHTGQQGPWEYYGSGTALGRMAAEAARSGRFARGLEIGPDLVTGEHVIDALAHGDNEAARLFDAFCREVARGACNLVLTLDPERIVLGGGLAEIGDPLSAGVDHWIQRLLTGQAHRPRVEVVLAELGDDAGAIGAALFGADQRFG